MVSTSSLLKVLQVLLTFLSSAACIRGHRVSRCNHLGRQLLDIRRPGRPLTSCPHPPGRHCSCQRLVIDPRQDMIPESASISEGSSSRVPVNTGGYDTQTALETPAAAPMSEDGLAPLMLSEAEAKELDAMLMGMPVEDEPFSPLITETYTQNANDLGLPWHQGMAMPLGAECPTQITERTTHSADGTGQESTKSGDGSLPRKDLGGTASSATGPRSGR